MHLSLSCRRSRRCVYYYAAESSGSSKTPNDPGARKSIAKGERKSPEGHRGEGFPTGNACRSSTHFHRNNIVAFGVTTCGRVPSQGSLPRGERKRERERTFGSLSVASMPLASTRRAVDLAGPRSITRSFCFRVFAYLGVEKIKAVNTRPLDYGCWVEAWLEPPGPTIALIESPNLRATTTKPGSGISLP